MVTTIKEVVTPQMAREYLKTGTHNRNVSAVTVERYAKTMREGKWMYNGIPIVFDINGSLIDGQHRLLAVIKSGVPIETDVKRGIATECFTTFDCGRHRKAGQLIGMLGAKNYNAVSSTILFAYRLEESLAVENRSIKGANKTNTDIVEMFLQDREAYEEAANFEVMMRNRANVVEISMVGGIYYYLVNKLGYNKENVEYFFEQVCSLETARNSTVELLRKRLIKNKMSKTERMNKNVILAIIIKAWNAYVTGNTLKTLKYNSDIEDKPQFINRNEMWNSIKR